MLGRRVRVMVVEDDPDCLAAMTIALECGGFAVAPAANGHEALRYLDAHPPPDLILLDLMMPVMDGRQFLQEQRARSAFATIPVVVVSGESELASRARELGVAGYLRKPVDLTTLLGTVRATAARPRGV